MPISNARVSALDAAIRAAGIPINGLSVSGTPGPTTVTVQYQASATAEQIAAGDALRDGWDYRIRRALTAAQIVSGIGGLTAAQQTFILRRLVAIVARMNVDEVVAALAAANVPLAVDEVDPTAA